MAKSAQWEYSADISPNFSNTDINGGQEHEPKLRTRGRPFEARLRRLTVFLLKIFITGTSGAGSPRSASFIASFMPLENIN